MKKLIQIFSKILLVIIIIMFAIFYYFSKPVRYTSYSSCNFSCEIPADSEKNIFFEYGWHKHRFDTKGTVYISHQKFTGSPESVISNFEQYIKQPVYTFNVNIFNNGKFYLQAHGKNKRRYIYLFTVENEIFWIENYTAYSTLRIYKDIVDHILIKFRYNGKKTQPDLPPKLKEINPKIIRYSQGLVTLLIFIFVPMIIIFIAAGYVMYRFSNAPHMPDKKILRKSENIYMFVKGPWTWKGTLGWCVLTDNELIVKPFALKKLTLSKEDFHYIRLKTKKNESFIFIEKQSWKYSLYIPNANIWYNSLNI